MIDARTDSNHLVVDRQMGERLLQQYREVCCTIHGATITPEGADVFLARNVDNFRTFKAPHARMLAHEMVTGRFAFNGMPITFDTRGVLVNGQHRLRACETAQAPFVTNIVFGLNPTTRRKTDIGQMKRGADAVLRDLQAPHYTTASTICRDAIACIRDQSFERHVAHVSESEIGQFYESHRQAIDDSVSLSLPIRRIFKASAVGAIFFFLVKLRRKGWTQDLVNMIAGDAPAKRAGAASSLARLAWKHNALRYDDLDTRMVRRAIMAANNIDWLRTKHDGTKLFDLAEAERLGGTLCNRFPQNIVPRV